MLQLPGPARGKLQKKNSNSRLQAMKQVKSTADNVRSEVLRCSELTCGHQVTEAILQISEPQNHGFNYMMHAIQFCFSEAVTLTINTSS